MSLRRGEIKLDDSSIPLVLAVSRLGELDFRGWWRTHAFSQAGRYTLGRLFRRTWAATAFEVNILSAVRRHDEILERPTALHLFSDQLPFRRSATAWLAEVKSGMESDLIQDLASLNLDTLVDRIKTLAADARPHKPKVVASALHLGNLKSEDLKDESALGAAAKKLAYAYIDQNSDFRPPYFDLVP
jgi:hypothetical protein